MNLTPPAVYASFSQQGVSEDALRLRREWDLLFGSLVNYCTLGSQFGQLRCALARLPEEAGRVDWDGHGGAPVDRDSLIFAKQLAQFLPFSAPAPEVSVDPDGEVSFDWRGSTRHIVSCSISPTGTLRYAGIIGASEVHGKEPWQDGIPEAIVRLLQRMVSTTAP